MPHSEHMVSCAWLAERLDAPDIKILDATSFTPADPRDPKDCFLQTRIPNARFFDINDIADKSTGLSHSMPKPETFMSRISRLGIGDGLNVVIYDANGGTSAAMRTWWMFRYFGHRDVSILDGGLPKWLADGYRVADHQPTKLMPRDYRHFTPRQGIGRVVGREDVLEASQNGTAVIVDARARERYTGEVPEPRPSINLGHIPGSINLPNQHILNEDKTLKTPEELREILTLAGVPLDDTPVIATCGTGVTACAIAFAASLLGKDDVAIYDGSWEDWGNTEYLPTQTGLNP